MFVNSSDHGRCLQGDILEVENYNPRSKKHMALIENKSNSSWDSVQLHDDLNCKLLPSHKCIVSLTRLLTIPQKVDAFLSTRDAGIYALLA